MGECLRAAAHCMVTVSVWSRNRVCVRVRAQPYSTLGMGP